MTKDSQNSGLVNSAGTNLGVLEDRVQESWKRHSRILKLRHKIGSTFLKLGEELYEFGKLGLYIEQGCDTFEEYAASIGLSRSTAYAWRSIYEVFVLQYEIPRFRLERIPWSKLEKIRGKVNQENVEELLFMAKELSISDLQKETEASVYRTFEVCKDCGGLKVDGTIRICECDSS